MKTLPIFAAVLMLSSFTLAQAPQPGPSPPPEAKASANAPGKIPVPASIAKDQLWVATHKRDMVEKQISELHVNLIEVEQQAQEKLTGLRNQQKQAADEIEAARTKLFAQSKVDQATYDLNEDMTDFVPKPATKAEVKK